MQACANKRVQVSLQGRVCWHDAAPVLFVVLYASLVAVLNMSMVS
jgi:hypothetical protein